MRFIQKLEESWQNSGSCLQVGLDPDPKLFPKDIKNGHDSIFEFCRGIIDATVHYICSFKLQIAHFSAYRAETQLEKICLYIRKRYPGIPIILDSKRGDIFSTSEKYALEAFKRYKVHALTVNPYMGFDSIKPYLQWKDRGVIVVCCTSNPGSSDLQFLNLSNGKPLYLYIAQLVKKWNESLQLGLVIGANHASELATVRKHVGDSMPLLIPGVGAQGGSLENAVHAGINSIGTGIMVNSSRGIIHSSSGKYWRESAASAAFNLREAINAAKISKLTK